MASMVQFASQGSARSPARGLAIGGVNTTRTDQGRQSVDEVEDIKARLKQMKCAESKSKRDLTSATDLYYATGCCQTLARSMYFENITLVVIILNAIWLAIDADYNKEALLVDADIGFQVVEHMFCTFFFAEWSVRFASYRKKWYGIKDFWFVFDSVLVFLMVMETWVMSLVIVTMGAGEGGGFGSASVLRLFRLMRLMRMARMVRLLRAMPELLILVKGMAAATRSVVYALCLLLILMYIFGIIFRHLTRDHPPLEQYFGSVPQSMITLMVYGIFWDSIGKLIKALILESGFFACIFMIYVLLSALMVMNLVIGVLCEVVSDVSDREKELIAVDSAISKFTQLIKDLDEDHDGTISRREFIKLVKKPNVVAVLQDLGLDALSLVDVVDNVFEESQFELGSSEPVLDVEDFMASILRFRCSTPATLKDIIDLRCYVTELLDHRMPPGQSDAGMRKTKTATCNVASTKGAPLLKHSVSQQRLGRLLDDNASDYPSVGGELHDEHVWAPPGVPDTHLDEITHIPILAPLSKDGGSFRPCRLDEDRPIPPLASRCLAPLQQHPTQASPSDPIGEQLMALATTVTAVARAVETLRVETTCAIGDLKDRAGKMEAILKASALS